MAQRRRGKGEGSIRHRADGRWEARVDIGRGVDGKRRRKSVFGATEAEVIKRLKGLHGRSANGTLIATSTPTVKTYLDDWYATNKDSWKPSTQRCYRGAIDLHLVPVFGAIRLEQLTPVRIQRWLTNHKEEHGARRRIELAHAALRSALSDAQRLQLVAINAAMLVKVPKAMKRPIRPFDIDQAKAFLKAAHGHRLGVLFSVALACGLRLGEATGLPWPDCDLETGELDITQQLQAIPKKGLVIQSLKTVNSRRKLVLPDVCLVALRAHRTKQLEERLKAGDRWVESGLVFGTYRTYSAEKGRDNKVGAPLHPRNVTRVLNSILKASKLPQIRFHDLRHSAASLLLAQGVGLVEVSKLLGHSELRVTADLYAHLQKQTATKAAGLMDAVLNG